MFSWYNNYYWQSENNFLYISQSYLFWQVPQFLFESLSLSQKRHNYQFFNQNILSGILSLSTKKFDRRNSHFSWNGYPLSFIFFTMEKRLKFHTLNKNTTHNLQIKEKYFTILYVHSQKVFYLLLICIFIV